MKLRAIQLTNFRQHASSTIEFGPGITGIIGPNGTGKTTILEAIAWALYGNEAARGRRDSIRFARADAKAPVRVELDFELGHHRYRVARGLTSAELYLDGGEQPIANSITSVADILHRRIGMSRAEFFNTYFTGQKELTVMSSLGPTERAQFLSRVLGYERLKSAQELARDRRRTLIAELSGLRQVMPDAGAVMAAVTEATALVEQSARHRTDARTAHDRAKKDLSELTPRWAAAERDRAQRQQTAGDLRLAEAELSTRERDRQRMAAEVAGFAEAQTELAALLPRIAPMPALTAERVTLDALAQNEGRRQTLAETLKATDEETAKLGERRKALETAPQLEKEVTAARDAKRAEVIALDAALLIARTEWVSAKQEAETKRESLRSQYADIRKHLDDIVTAGDSGKCPTCQRPLEEHFRGVLDELNDQLELVKVDGNFYKQRVEQLSAVPAEVVDMELRTRQASVEADALERKLSKVQHGVTELAELNRTLTRYEQRAAEYRADLAKLATGYDAERHTAVRRELESLTPLAQRANRLATLTERSDAARAELVAATQAYDAAAARTSVLREAVSGYAMDEAAWQAIQAAQARATATLHECAVAVARADSDAAAARDALKRAEAARAELLRAEERQTSLSRERRLHDELDYTYTDLRTDLNFGLRPEISRVASEFLTILTNARFTELDLDDEYNLVVVEDGLPKPVISGGEEDVANLAIRLAISQMIAERTGQAFSLLILDEVFGSLDESRQQHVMSLLRGLYDKFEQIVLITHVGSVFEQGDRVLHVHLDPDTGASVVEEGEPMPDEGALIELVS